MAGIRVFNFLNSRCPENRDAFFDNDSVLFYPPEIESLDRLLVWAGVFMSARQARASGFEGPIPLGHSSKETGKLRYFIVNPQFTKEEWTQKEIAEGQYLNEDGTEKPQENGR